MNLELQRRLAETAQQWQALSRSISSAEKTIFDALHDGFFTSYGPNFMAHVYRSAIEQVLQNIPDTERDKLLAAFQHALDTAITKHAYALPTAANCFACRSPKP
ncbi:hypothetical protein GCM10011375_38630 [Hymenobacter qilianensis]|uniref:Uncharacterized protein n=2 Tax=Hymenobacter qilianensis TaxID=1385715 RepID=A0ACB5PWX2_9BACT|nr:hypothetical protein [Hymenobacter qilianensis]QNP54264.1 hypothetical protein H9L05_21575 [Hymenobacter qilianensis]GGF79850.1 hypothetical protein GCM10011375_38630 [Hymenobacter qilianensis]